MKIVFSRLRVVTLFYLCPVVSKFRRPSYAYSEWLNAKQFVGWRTVTTVVGLLLPCRLPDVLYLRKFAITRNYKATAGTDHYGSADTVSIS
jgi:hypothetical protein